MAQRQSQIGVQHGSKPRRRGAGQCFAQHGFGLRRLSGLDQYTAQRQLCRDQSRTHKRQQITQHSLRLIQPMQPLQRATQLIKRLMQIGLERNGCLEGRKRFVVTPLFHQRPAQRQRYLRLLGRNNLCTDEQVFGIAKAVLAHADGAQRMQHARIAARLQRGQRGVRRRAIALPQQAHKGNT